MIRKVWDMADGFFDVVARHIPLFLIALTLFFFAYSDTPKTAKTKESLVQKYAQDPLKTLLGFPYPDGAEGKKLVESVVTMLNSAEEVFAADKVKQNDAKAAAGGVSSAYVRQSLGTVSMLMTLERLKWVIDGKAPPTQKYTISWENGQWVAKELTKEKG